MADQARQDFYDFAGLFSTGAGTMLSTHVGDDLQMVGFQEGGNPPEDADPIRNRVAHPIFSPSVQLLGLGVLVVAVLYMDKRIKVKL